MKIIELLNKIANGEEVPKKIKYNETLFSYAEGIDYKTQFGNFLMGGRVCICSEDLNDEVEIIEEEKKLHANDIEFNINNGKKDCIITLDENDLGIDKLHLDNCYFYKENDKWYVKHINLKPIAYISQEHKIPEKLKIRYKENDILINEKILQEDINDELANKINEILDYLEVNNDRER